MKWRGRRQSSNVEVRSGGGGGPRMGGFPLGSGTGGGGRGFPNFGGGIGTGGLGGLILVVLVVGAFYLFSGGFGEETAGPQTTTTELTQESQQFLATILADTEDAWTEIFAQGGQDYPEPTLVFYEGGTQTACGFGDAAIGPFYCPGDRNIYLDLSFLGELERDFDAAGDFAQAYIVAHEVGHHIQNITGALQREQQLAQGRSEAERNALSVRTELQADCYAGIVGSYMEAQGYLDVGDLNEALNAARQIGDDAIQMRTQGYVVPESFNHGTSAQRAEWFRRGYESNGNVAACDTFADL
ncbi:MAG: zinc metallopeptidase [Bauldia sp.]|nr:zinc metallopeptidase [Bauldia sp.]